MLNVKCVFALSPLEVPTLPLSSTAKFTDMLSAIGGTMVWDCSLGSPSSFVIGVEILHFTGKTILQLLKNKAAKR